MYFKELIAVLCIVCGVSCRPQTDEDDLPPSYILNEQQFIKVLTDCYLGEGAAGINVKNVTGEKFDSAYVFNPFKDNGITKKQFDTTVVYYSQHPQKLREIYNKLLENLSRIQATGTLGKVIVDEKDKYKNQDARFFFTASKMDSIDRASRPLGYYLKPPYRLN